MKHSPLLVALLSAAATTGAGAQQRPPLRQIGPVLAVSAESLGIVSAVRPLSNGQILVNDVVKRRVLLLDSTLAHATVVADSTSSTANAYGPRAGGLIAYRGDTTLFVDVASLSMLVVDPSGKLGRTMSVPRSQDAPFLANATAGTPGFDAQGRLIYRQFPRPPMPQMGPDGKMTSPEPPESTAVIRVDLATRKVDTVAFVKIPKLNMKVTQNANGGISISSTINPLQVADDWAVLRDGSVALVRAKDYHVDWINPDGSMTSSEKIPFDWKRLTDEDKVAIIDSARVAMEKMRATAMATMMGTAAPKDSAAKAPASGPAANERTAQAAAAAARGGAEGAQVMVFRNGGGGAAVVGPGGGGIQMPPLNFVQPSELPDYRPPFTPGGIRPDPDGNLWIRTIATTVASPGTIYDVVNRKGELIDRVQLPPNRAIAGFGPGGVAYLSMRGEDGVARVEKVRIK
jgi:hypothetical protein